MNKLRKAFTLIELLVVVGIIAVLALILLPVIKHARFTADVTTGKADMQAIASALEQYRQEFGDYPHNNLLQSWNQDVPLTSGQTATECPAYLTLASALIAPGPMVTQNVSINGQNVLEAGDGADGPGFRVQTTTPDIASVPNADVTGQFSSSAAASPVQYSYTSLSPGSTLETLPMVTLTSLATALGSIPSTDIVTIELKHAGPPAVDETVTAVPTPIYPTGASPAFSVTSAPLFSFQSGDTAIVHIRTPTAKAWPNYLPADRFKVAFLNYTQNNNNIIGQPVLLDRWGQVIQYFPRHGPANDRTGDSIVPYTPYTPNVIGPLYGYSAPRSIYTATAPPPPSPYGLNSIWDERDGVPILNADGTIASSWHTPAYVTTLTSISITPPQVTVAVPAGVTIPSIMMPPGTINIVLGIGNAATLETIAVPQLGNSPGGTGSLTFNLSSAPANTHTAGEQVLIQISTNGGGDVATALQWVLGDENGDNLINSGESLRYNGPYVLISAGPGGPNRDDGGFFTLENTHSAAERSHAFAISGNIYNFDR